MPALLVAAFMGGTVYAGTPDGYPGGWYRLFRPCEVEGLEAVSDLANADPSLLVVTGSWQAKLVVAGLTEDADRVWFAAPFFWDPKEQEKVIGGMHQANRPIIAVTDVHLFAEYWRANDTFLHQSPWQPVGTWCTAPGIETPRLAAYYLEPGSG